MLPVWTRPLPRLLLLLSLVVLPALHVQDANAAIEDRPIAAGLRHTCALTTTGAVECWGSNAFGQLGDGNTAETGVPVSVTGLASGVAAIAAGWHHTCALTTGGAVACWGRNDYYQLGNGHFTHSSVPVPVVGFGPLTIPALGGAELAMLAAALLATTLPGLRRMSRGRAAPAVCASRSG